MISFEQISEDAIRFTFTEDEMSIDRTYRKENVSEEEWAELVAHAQV